MDSKELTTAVHQLWSAIDRGHQDKSYATRKRMYEAGRDELEQKWKFGFLFDKYPDMHPDALELIFEQAWEDGHSSGYWQVEYNFRDLTDMVKKILDISRDRA